MTSLTMYMYIHAHVRSYMYVYKLPIIGGGTGGAGGASAPTIFYLGGQCPHTILVANGTLRRNARLFAE